MRHCQLLGHSLLSNNINSPPLSSMATPQRPRYTVPSSPPPGSQGHVTVGHNNVEGIRNYCSGGYRPTHIGDVLSSTLNQYTIIHKLGFGPASTVWCVRRECDLSFHALKIYRASISDRHFEKRIVEFMRLAAAREAEPALVYVEESFITKSHNGSHCCLVLPILGPSLFDPRVDCALHPEARQTISEHLTFALERLHSRNVCHSSEPPSEHLLPHISSPHISSLYSSPNFITPQSTQSLTHTPPFSSTDLSPSHVLVRIPNASSSAGVHPNEDQILELLGPVQRDGVNDRKKSSHPTYLVKPASFPSFPFSSVRHVGIIGFTNAWDSTVKAHIPKPV